MWKINTNSCKAHTSSRCFSARPTKHIPLYSLWIKDGQFRFVCIRFSFFSEGGFVQSTSFFIERHRINIHSQTQMLRTFNNNSREKWQKERMRMRRKKNDSFSSINFLHSRSHKTRKKINTKKLGTFFFSHILILVGVWKESRNEKKKHQVYNKPNT